MNKNIFWSGYHPSLKRNEGYKNSQDELLKHLSKKINIVTKCLIAEDVVKLLDAGINLLYESLPMIDISSDLLINNRLPPEYAISNGYNVGFTYWETEQLPKLWVEHMNMMDEIWTTSKWAKNVFINSGVKVPVFDFQLGVEPSLFFPKLRYKRSPFHFLSIGAPSTRKNSQIAVNAFLDTFAGVDDVFLIYKCIGEPDARIYPDSSARNSVYKHSKIKVIDIDLPIEQLSELYDSIDCLIYPTSGEGWGLMPYQSIAKGIPTICTNATACTEFAEMSVPLNFSFGKNKMSGIYEDAGVWAEPDYQDLCDKMLMVYTEYDKVANFTYDNAAKQFPSMSWDCAAEGFYKRICQILNV